MSNMVVNTNILSLNAHRNLSKVGIQQTKASSRLSSGLRVNSAADDAAGLAISEKMRAQIRGLDMATKNAQDGISMIQTAEGGMQEIENMAQRIRELVVQAANDSNEPEDRKKIGDEIEQLIQEMDAMAERTEFNKKKILSGSFSDGGTNSVGSLALQVGANEDQLIQFYVGTMTAMGLSDTMGTNGVTTASGVTYHGIGRALADLTAGNVMTAVGISKLISLAEAAVQLVTDERAKLGAVQNRVEYTMNNLKVSSENLSAAESRIRDTDMAKEMMNLTRANILQQAATSMLAQANQAPQSVLQLLQ